MTEFAAATYAEPAPSLRPLPTDVVSIQSQIVYGWVGNNVAVVDICRRHPVYRSTA